MELGTKVNLTASEVAQMFQPPEGFNAVYYGSLGNGKTYAATADILELLRRGEQVVANWKVDFSGYDERQSFWVSLIRFLGNKSSFYKYKPDNFRFITPDDVEKNLPWLNRLVGVHVFLDEGQWIFNSQVRNPDIQKRKLVLHGRHYCRSLNIITQRPNNLFKDVRSQVNIWYKCVKRFHFGSFIVFQRWEFQEMKEDLPDEEIPAGRPKHYIGDKVVFAAYNTHAMREEDAISRGASFDLYETSTYERLMLVVQNGTPEWAKRAVKRVLAPLPALRRLLSKLLPNREFEPSGRVPLQERLPLDKG